MGDVEEMIARQARLAGEPVPEHITNKPRLRQSEVFWYQSFFDLDTERAHGQGLTKIPRSAMFQYATECGLDEFDTYELIFVLRRVDDAHLDEMAKKRADAT